MRYTNSIDFILAVMLLVASHCAGTAFAAGDAEKRVALVIGNSAYQATDALRNPVNDASKLAEVLRRLGFTVIDGVNLTASDMDTKREAFSKALDGADIGLVFYAGHGIQIGGQNYLMPIDAKIANERSAVRELVALNDVIGEVEARAKATLVFLDACRNNPLQKNIASTRSAGGDAARGLARVEGRQNSNTLLVFATAPGKTAEDGLSQHSPFTEALLRHIETPGMEIEQMLKRVVRDVQAATNNVQQPERLSKLTTEFQFVSRAGPAPEPVLKQPNQVSRAEIAEYEQVKGSTDVNLITAYIDRYPGGIYANALRMRLRELGQGAGKPQVVVKEDPELECTDAMTVGTREAFKQFIGRFPTHGCADKFRRQMRTEADDVAWQRAERAGSITEYGKYLDLMPDGLRAGTAKDRIAALQAKERGETTKIVRAPTPEYVPAPQPQPVYPVEPLVTFRKFSNRWVDGSGYNVIRGVSSYAACEEYCRSDTSCRMFEFYFGRADGGRKCNLFRHTVIQSDSSSEAHVGIKQ